MASFPFQFEANFEVGDSSEWTATVGTQVAVQGYKELSRSKSFGMPFRGAYALLATLGVDTDSYVRSTSITISSGAVGHARFMFYVGDNLAASTTTELLLYTTQPAVAACGLQVDADGTIKFGIRSCTDALTVSDAELERGRWYTATLIADTTQTNTCTATVEELDISLTTANDVITGAVTEGRLGVIGVGADSLANVTGNILLDQLATDDAAIDTITDRFPQHLVLTKTSHIFLGTGHIKGLQLVAGAGTDCEVLVFDTDEASTSDYDLKLAQTNNTSSEVTTYDGAAAKFSKGAYAVLSGTDPRVIVTICNAPNYGSDSTLRALAKGA